MPNSPKLFSQQTSEARTRVEKTGRDAATLRQHALLPETFEELQAAMQELQVAEEELHQQNDQLAEAQTALLRERQRYQDLFDWAPDGYLVTDENGVMREANRAAALLLGISVRYLVGKPLSGMVVDEERRAFRVRLLEAGRSAETLRWQTRLRRRGAADFDAALSVSGAGGGLSETPRLRWLVRDLSADAPAS